MRGIVRLAGAGLIPALVACGAGASTDSGADAPAQAGASGAAAAGGAGGAGGAAGRAGGGGGAGTAGAAVALAPKGSFSVRLSPASAPGSKAKGGANLGPELRVDLLGSSAVVTPRWGWPSKFQLSDKGNALILSGSVTARADDVTYAWQSLSLELDAGRKLTGKVTASGQQSVFDGGVGASSAIHAMGEVTLDATAPEARLELASPFTGGARLPWEPLTFRFSEPITPGALADRLEVSAPDAKEQLAIAWTFGPAGGASGAVLATGVLPTFDSAAGSLSVRALAGYSDAVGNEGAPLAAEVEVLSVPAASGLPLAPSAVGFQGVVTWGKAVISGSALTLGPLALGSCEVAPTGGAGRATLSAGATKLEVKYRVIAAPKAPGVSPVTGALPAISLLVATPGVAPTTKELLAPTLTEATAEGMLASPWTSAILPIQIAPGGEVGWALRAGALTSSGPCGGETVELASVDAAVQIASVSAL